MFGLPFFKKNKKSNKFLVAEIDTNSIRVLSFYNDAGKIKIIGSAVVPVKENSLTPTYILDKDSVAMSLQEAVNKATQDLAEPVQDIIIGIKGNISIEVTTTAKATSIHNRIIQNKDMDEVYNRIIEAAYIQAQNEIIQTTGVYDSKIEIITSSSVYTKLDEKTVENPIELEGAILENAVFNAFALSDSINDLKKVVKKAGLNLLAVSPIPYALVQNIANADIEETTDYTLINMGKDITELIIVFGKGIVGTKTMPIGYNHLIEGISNKMGLTEKESERVLETYSSGQLTESEEIVIQKCLNEVLLVWLEGLKICFEEFNEVKTFASNIYLTGEGILVPDILALLKSNPWYKNIPFKTIPDSRKLEINDFNNIGDATGKINAANWLPILSLGNIYLEVQEEND